MALKIQLIIVPPENPGEDLGLLAARAKDARPAMKSILEVMLEGERKEFGTAGAAGGRAWRRDSRAWEARKLQQGKPAGPERYTDALMRSLTDPHAPHAVRRVNRQSAILGTTLFYSRFQRRPVLSTLRYVPGVVQRAQDILVEWFMRGTTTR